MLAAPGRRLSRFPFCCLPTPGELRRLPRRSVKNDGQLNVHQLQYGDTNPARRIRFSRVDVIVPVHQVLDLPLDDPLIKNLADCVPLFGLRGAFGTALVRLPLSASSGHGYCGTGVADGGETRGAQDVGRRRHVESYSWNYSCDNLDRPGRACDDRVQRSTLRYKSTEAWRATTMITRLLARRRAEEQAISVPLTHVILLEVLELGRRQHDRATVSGWLEGPLRFRAPQ